jgi:hypothetical protein
MRTYYLFIDKAYCIQKIFENLQLALEPGIKYIQIKEHIILPPYILIESSYKDEYFKNKINEELSAMGYDKSFKILKPPVNEMCMLQEE